MYLAVQKASARLPAVIGKGKNSEGTGGNKDEVNQTTPRIYSTSIYNIL